MPPEWQEKPDKLAQKDTDARWTKKGGVSYYGYKDHAKVDAGSKLIEDFAVTAAQAHDSQPFDQLVTPEDGTLWADSAYSGEACQQVIEAKGVAGQICENTTRNRNATPRNRNARTRNNMPASTPPTESRASTTGKITQEMN